GGRESERTGMSAVARRPGSAVRGWSKLTSVRPNGRGRPARSNYFFVSDSEDQTMTGAPAQAVESEYRKAAEYGFLVGRPPRGAPFRKRPLFRRRPRDRADHSRQVRERRPARPQTLHRF